MTQTIWTREKLMQRLDKLCNELNNFALDDYEFYVNHLGPFELGISMAKRGIHVGNICKAIWIKGQK